MKIVTRGRRRYLYRSRRMAGATSTEYLGRVSVLEAEQIRRVAERARAERQREADHVHAVEGEARALAGPARDVRGRGRRGVQDRDVVVRLQATPPIDLAKNNAQKPLASVAELSPRPLTRSCCRLPREAIRSRGPPGPRGQRRRPRSLHEASAGSHRRDRRDSELNRILEAGSRGQEWALVEK